MKKINNILNIIKKANNTAIVCHQNPDGDTLGSAFALSAALTSIHKNSDVLCQDELPDKYSIMNTIPLANKFDSYKYDLIVFLDCAEIMLAGNLFDNEEINDYTTINIDHHSTNSNYAKLNLVNSNSSSTAEIVLDLIKLMDINITKEIAEYIYIAILTDTGQFAYSYTSSKTHDNASFLIKCGVDFSRLQKEMFHTIKRSKILLQRQMLNNMSLLHENQIAISILSNKDFSKSHANSQDSESLVNILLSIEGVKIAVLVKQIDKNICRASFRSADDVDISIVAKHFGGGGHKQASGATLECNISQAKDEIYKTIKNTGILK